MNKFISLIIFNFLLLYSFGYNIAIVGLCSSHLYNTIPFAKLLRENGHDVTYVTTVECKSRVLGAGAVLYKEKKWDAFVSSLGDSYLPGPLKALSFGREYLWYYSSTSSDELDAWLQEGNRPDIIVSHALHPLVPTYADKYDIPYLLFYANGFHLVTEETIHKTQFKIDGRATEGSFVYNQISEVQKVGFYIFYSMLQCIDKINHIREEHGLPKFTTSSHLWQSYPLVTPLAQPFVYHGEIDNLYKISPLPHITSKETIPEDILTWLQSSKQPVIYMALGTSTNLTEENIETILGQFQLQRNYRILWSLKQVEAYEKAFAHHIAIVGACTSHIYNAAPFTKLLVQNGHKVTFVTPSKCKTVATAAGASLYADKNWEDFPTSHNLDQLSVATEFIWHYSYIASKELDEWIQSTTTPDIVVGHCLNSLVSTIADKHNIPFVLFYANGVPLVTEDNIHVSLINIEKLFAKNSLLHNQAARGFVGCFSNNFSLISSLNKINDIRKESSLETFSTISHLWHSYPIVCPFNEPLAYHGNLENLYQISLLPQMESWEPMTDDVLEWLNYSEQPILYMALGTSGFINNDTITVFLNQFQLQSNLQSFMVIEASRRISRASDAYTHHVAIVGACTSHIFNSIPLARLLIENGHKVTFVTPNKCRSRILSVGAELYKDKTWPEFKASDYANPFLEVIFAKESMWHSSSVASKELDEWLQDKTKLDVIIGHGLNPLVSTIADKHQIPFLLYYANGIPLVTDENLHKPLLKIDQIFAKNSFLYNQAAEILVVGFHQIFAFMTSIEKINHMRDSLSLQYVSTISQLWQSYPIVCPFNEPFVYHGSLENLYKISLLPQMHSLMSIPDDILQWLMSSEQPVIYMALGTSVGFTLSNQTLDMIFTIFQKQTYYRILWSLKQAEQYEQKIVDPNHLMIKKFLPQIALLERPEIAGFLTHCGAASIMEAVKFEVPLILYPQGRDQMFTAMNAFDAGVGIYLNSPETLSKVLAEFMDKHDVLKKNVVEARKQVASIKGWDRLSKLITDLARSKKSSFIQRDDVLLFYIYKWLTILAMLVLGILSLFGYIFYRCCCKSKPKKLKQQ